MAGRVFLILLFGVALSAGLAFALADIQRQTSETLGREQRLVDRLADFAVLLDRAPPQIRPGLLGPGPEAPFLDASQRSIGDVDDAITRKLAARLASSANPQVSKPWAGPCAPRPAPPPPPASAALPPPVKPPIAKPEPPKPPTCRSVALTLASGERIQLTLPTGPAPPPATTNLFNPVFLLVIGLAAAGLALVVARLATAPLSRLARAAQALGDDLERQPLAIEGPLEVRRAAHAFNAMQQRLKRHLDERTHMLAAITHDLQTPLTRQRLRLEKVTDPALRSQLLADHAAMRDLIREGLDLARTASETEAWEELDIDSLLESLRDDACEAGLFVRLSKRCGVTVRTRPRALRRAVANLLDNALNHAGAAELAATSRDGRVTLWVKDRGPGIAPSQLDAVLEPFVRLETSRSRATGGSGLGLTIAHRLAERAGAVLRLANRQGGGLEASIELAASPRA